MGQGCPGAAGPGRVFDLKKFGGRAEIPVMTAWAQTLKEGVEALAGSLMTGEGEIRGGGAGGACGNLPEEGAGTDCSLLSRPPLLTSLLPILGPRLRLRSQGGSTPLPAPPRPRPGRPCPLLAPQSILLLPARLGGGTGPTRPVPAGPSQGQGLGTASLLEAAAWTPSSDPSDRPRRATAHTAPLRTCCALPPLFSCV